MAVRRRRRKSGISGEIQDFAKSFEAGWKMADRIKNPEGRGRRVSDAEERRRENEREYNQYQSDAERDASRRAGGGGGGGGGEAVAASSTEVSDRFMNVVQTEKNGLTNPYGLAATAAFGQRESNWSPSRVNATWSDRSESGKAGTSGGTLSWRAERLTALKRYAANLGEKGLGSPETQARFFLQEDPRLISQLQNAKSPEEASEIMGKAWRYAGWNRNSPERAARTSATKSWVGKFKKPDAAEPKPAAPTKPAPSPADAEPKQQNATATDTAIPEEGYGDETQNAQGYGQDQGYDQDQDQDYGYDQETDDQSDADSYDQGYEDEFDTGGYGDDFDMEFSQGGVVPAPTWSQGAADARGSRFSSYSGSMPARQPRVRTAPTATTATTPARPLASDRIKAMRAARAAKGSEYERMVASNKAANEKRLADKEAAKNKPVPVDPPLDPNRHYGSMDNPMIMGYEGGYVDRVDPDDEVYQERARVNYEGIPTEDDEYARRDDPDEVRGRLQEEEYRRGERSGGYREEGGYDELPTDRRRTSFAGESPSTREDKGTPSRPRARFAGESPSTREDKGTRAAIPEKPAPKKEGPARKQEARPASSTRSSAAAPAARPAARQASSGNENPHSAIGFIEDQFRQRDALVGKSPASSLVAEGAAGGIGEAVSAGLKWIQSSFGFDSGAINPGPNDPQRQRALRALASNEGAASTDDVRTIDRTIDPENKLQPHERALARLYGAYKFYVDRGEEAKASKVAGAMLMHIREKVQLYGSVVADRLQKGDNKGAAEAAQVAYDQLPNGKRAEVKPDGNQFSYSLFDADGEITEQGKMTVNQMMRVATGMQDGTTWFKELGKLASPRDKEARLRREGEARRAPRNADGSPMTGRARTAARPTEGERKERLAEEQRAAARLQADGALRPQADAQKAAVDDVADMTSGEGIRARATSRQEIDKAGLRDRRELDMMEQAYNRSLPKTNVPKADADEIMAGAAKVFGGKGEGADPFGQVPEQMRASASAVVSRAAARAIAATPGLTSSEAGRTVSNMFKYGMQLRPDGSVAPANEPRSPGIRLDRQSVEDISRLRTGGPGRTLAAREAATGPAKPNDPRMQLRPGMQAPAARKPVDDPSVVEGARSILQRYGIPGKPPDPNVSPFSDMGM